MANIREHSISWGALWRVLAIFILVAVLFVARDVLVATVLAIILSSALDPLVNWLQDRRIPRILGTLAIYLLAILLLALVIYILAPVALVELSNLFNVTADAVGGFGDTVGGAGQELFLQAQEKIREITDSFLSGEVGLFNLAFRFLGGMLLTFIILVLSFYMTLDRHGVKKFLITIVPQGYQADVLDVYNKVRSKISSWFIAQLFLSLVVGLAVFVGLWLLGVKYSLLLGILAGILELVPYVGPIFSGFIATLFALSASPALAVWTVLLFIVIQQLEASFLVPTVMGRSTKLSPVVVLVALLVGWEAFGIIGAILAVPLAVTFQEIIYHWSVTRNTPEELSHV
ncbi:MAG: AI-2E family transporter [Candidatus Harrisonbacteria bacterium]|nr:AI-2E family transporter [Candidatus Harrisonbacteria bacterium]